MGKEKLKAFKSKKKEVQQQLDAIYEVMEKEEVATAHLEKEKNATTQLFQLNREEEEHWRLKSCSMWLKAGDENTSFFHKKAKACEMKNRVRSLNSSNGTHISLIQELKTKAHEHFKNLYTESVDMDDVEVERFLSPIPKVITDLEN